MPIYAATATHPPTGTLFLIALIVGIAYLAACVIWPFRACRRCGGSGRFLSPTRRAWRHCTRCGGTGARLRAGRQIYKYFKGIRDRGHS